MKETVLESIVAFFLGHKYYATIMNTRGTMMCDISSCIYPTKEQAEEHKRMLESNSSYRWVETISFRSRNVYKTSLMQGYNHSFIE